jgi:glycerol-3-phosphate O-acyltransferase / dihydroxyacetone phosphate acyltransferase
MKLVRALLLRLFRQIMRIYFREIEVVGAPAASTARRLFAANHVNGLVDPLLVLTTTGCPIAPVAKAALWKIPGLGLLLAAAQAVPVVRRQDDPNKAAGANEEVFQRLAGHLVGGGNILIFPEGISHSEPHVMPLRSGAGRMLTEAHQRGVRGLSFQAVGLEFEARGTFRSRVLVVYGPVRSVDELGLSGDALAGAITDGLRVDLPELVVEGRSWPERLLIARVAELLSHDAGDRSLAGWNSVGRRVEAAHRSLRPEDAALYDAVASAVNGYYAQLSAAGLTDADVLEGAASRRALRGLGLLVLAPLALLGALLYVVPYQIPKLAPYIAKEEGDVVSTYKLGLGLVAFPAWAAALVVASLIALPWPEGLAAGLLSLGAPFAALPWLDEIDRVRSMTAEAVRADEAPVDERALQGLRREAIAAISRARQRLEPGVVAPSLAARNFGAHGEHAPRAGARRARHLRRFALAV